MLNQKPIEYKLTSSLYFDPQNPRLPVHKKGWDEETILTWMLEDATIIELMMSIGEKGYFPGEALLVVPKQNNADQYTVIEGNRRLTAVKLLLDPQLAPIRKKSVEQASQEAKYKNTLEQLPVLIFDKREDIIFYLGYRHITGIKAWGALAKAKYLKQLLRSLGPGEPKEQHQILAKTIGSRADYVARTLAGLAVYEKIVDENFFGIKNLGEDRIDFAVLTTALTYSNIHKHVGMETPQDKELNTLDINRLGELTAWMFEKNPEGKTRLGESRNLGDLNNVLGNPEALVAFKEGRPLVEALILTEVPGEIFQKSIMEAKTRLEIAQSNLHRVKKFSKTHSDLLWEIRQIAQNMRTIVDKTLNDED